MKPNVPDLDIPKAECDKIFLSKSSLEKAIKDLSNGKAVGVDLLRDRILKESLKKSPDLRCKVLECFENWINGITDMPDYLI